MKAQTVVHANANRHHIPTASGAFCHISMSLATGESALWFPLCVARAIRTYRKSQVLRSQYELLAAVHHNGNRTECTAHHLMQLLYSNTSGLSPLLLESGKLDRGMPHAH
eukprot:evm.model.scf_670EXC.3 EVM.evm.TU.scf_670EXC.3   scf_670EXC:41301-41630(+)